MHYAAFLFLVFLHSSSAVQQQALFFRVLPDFLRHTHTKAMPVMKFQIAFECGQCKWLELLPGTDVCHRATAQLKPSSTRCQRSWHMQRKRGRGSFMQICTAKPPQSMRHFICLVDNYCSQLNRLQNLC